MNDFLNIHKERFLSLLDEAEAKGFEKSKKEIERLREALKLYADPKSFKDKIDNETSIPDFYDETDFGMFAREALNGTT